MEPVQMKFAAFMSALSPEEQRAVVPLMTAFVGTMGAPGGQPEGTEAPPLPPPGLTATARCRRRRPTIRENVRAACAAKAARRLQPA